MGMDGLQMTRWEVERDVRGYSVVAIRDGERQEVRRSLSGLACITAQVIRWELEHAYYQGRVDVRNDLAREPLGD